MRFNKELDYTVAQFLDYQQLFAMTVLLSTLSKLYKICKQERLGFVGRCILFYL